MTQPKKQRGLTVAITGAGSGLGRELALGFSAEGYRVFGTVHSANEIAELLEFADIRSKVILDIRRHPFHCEYKF